MVTTMTAPKPPSHQEIQRSIERHFDWLRSNVPWLKAEEPAQVFLERFFVDGVEFHIAESLKRMLMSEDAEFLSLANEATTAAKTAIRAASELAQALAKLESYCAVREAKANALLTEPMLGLLQVGQGVLHGVLDAEQRVSQIGRWSRITNIAEWRQHKSNVRETLVRAGIDAEVAYDLFSGEESAKTRTQAISDLRKFAPKGPI